MINQRTDSRSRRGKGLDSTRFAVATVSTIVIILLAAIKASIYGLGLEADDEPQAVVALGFASLVVWWAAFFSVWIYGTGKQKVRFLQAVVCTILAAILVYFALKSLNVDINL